ETGARLVGRRAFPDHHRFSRRDLFALDRQARTLGARLVTTEKDAARCPGVGSVLPIVIRFQQEEALRAALAGALTAAA
ncbi:hypothetical protein CTS44_24188, partial [Comamonas thiooxydans]